MINVLVNFLKLLTPEQSFDASATQKGINHVRDTVKE